MSKAAAPAASSASVPSAAIFAFWTTPAASGKLTEYIDSRYHALGVIGFLCSMLLLGKIVRVRATSLHAWHLPASVIGACAGAAVYWVAARGVIEESAWSFTLERVEICLINFVFTALFLGFRRRTTAGYRIRDVLRLVWHEGVPQLIYSEVVATGQNLVAVAVTALLRRGRPGMSQFMGGMVVLGLEAGDSVLPPSAVDGSDETENKEYAEEADALGLITSLALCLALINVRYTPWLRRMLGDEGRVARRPDVLEVEHFQRGGRHTEQAMIKPAPLLRRNTMAVLAGGAAAGAPPGAPSGASPLGASPKGFLTPKGMSQRRPLDDAAAKPARPAGDLRDPAFHRSAPEPRKRLQRVGSLMPGGGSLAGADEEVFRQGFGTGAARKGSAPGIGGHLGLIVVSIYVAYLLSLVLDEIESTSSFLSKYRLLSGFELAPWCMLFALLLVRLCFQNNVSFHFPWFHRLAGVFCDVLVVSAVASLQLPLESKDTFSGEFFVIFGCCLAWQAFSFVVLAPRLFPNYWFERGVAELGDMLGHSWTALVVLKEMDPLLQTPVPLAFAYKQLIYLIVPGPGFRNTLVIMAIDLIGEWPTVLVLAGVMAGWLLLFLCFYRERWARSSKKAPRGRRSAAKAGGSPSASPALQRAASLKQPLLPSQRQHVADIEAEATLVDDSGSDDAAASDAAGEPLAPLPRRVGGESSILSDAHVRELHAALPLILRDDDWRLVYNLQEDGALLSTLLAASEATGSPPAPQLLLVEDNWGYVFGAFLHEGLRLQPGFYGSGQSFVFTFHPEFTVHRWTGANDMFVVSNADGLGMGGGGKGFAFYLDDELDHGTSSASDTYGNARLSSSERFRCLSVEVWSV